MARLDEAVEAILDSVVDAVRAEVGPGQPLEGIASVVRGDRARPMPALPAVWVVPESATCVTRTFGEPEDWEMPVTIAALVKSDNPDDGGRSCARYAALARAAALHKRRLGLSYVVGTDSARFDGAARSTERNRNLFWADATVRVKFIVEEEA